MPDFVLVAASAIVSAVAAGLTLLAATRMGRTQQAWRLSAGWILGLAAGLYAGCGVLGHWPRWPMPEDRDRFLVIVLPLTLAIEAVAALWPSQRLTWLLRIGLAGVAAPVLLYHSVYLTDLEGPGSAEWSTIQSASIFLALGAVLAGVWTMLALMPSWTRGGEGPWMLVLVSVASGVTVMLSGYYQGGLLAVPLGSALAGAALASRAVPAQSPSQASGSPFLGVGLIGTYSVLVIGHFFGALPLSSAACLLMTPLTAWIAEVPWTANWGRHARGALRLAAVSVPLAVIVTLAQARFNEAFVAKSKPHQPPGAMIRVPGK